MVNLKLCGVIACLAFICSLLIGVFSKASMPSVIVRPIIFAVVFFVLTGLLNFLVKTFLPEFFNGASKGDDLSMAPGSRVNITEGEVPDFSNGFPSNETQLETPSPAPSKPAFMNTEEEHSESELGNISELMGKYVPPASGDETSETADASTGMDQNVQEGYTETRNMEELAKFSDNDGSGPDSFLSADSSKLPGGMGGSGSSSMEALPDLDAMAGAFMPASGDGETEATEYTVPSPQKKPSSVSKAAGWAGDFKAEEIAAGLRTILKKEG